MLTVFWELIKYTRTLLWTGFPIKGYNLRPETISVLFS